MSLAKSGAVLFALLITVSFPAFSADSELQGYTPPPMFGGSSTPLSPPVPSPKFEAPAEVSPKKEVVREEPEPLIKKPKIVPKPSPKIAAPPADKESIIVKDTPLPIEPLTPRAPTKSTEPPSDKEKVPVYVAPPVKKPEPKKIETAQPAPKKEIAAPTVNPGISAESLLDHAVTSNPTAPTQEDSNPLAVPVGKIDDALPLPGSVPPSKKSEPKKKIAEKKADKKSEPKKVEPKKSEAKKPELKKQETKKAEVKKTEEKKPEPKKAEIKKPEVKKEEPKKVVIDTAKKPESKPTPAPIAVPAPAAAPKIVEKTPELPLPVPGEKIEVPPVKTKVEEKPAYNIKGRKTMPTAMPTKVEKAELDEKTPLPPVEANPKLKSELSVNEQIIDHALEERLVQPDVKVIEKAAPGAKTGTKKNDGFVNPKPSNPPPIMYRNNSKGESSNPQTNDTPARTKASAPIKDKVKPQLVSVEFKEAATAVTDDMKNIIGSNLIANLKSDPSSRLQILAYASPTKDGQSSARRISLARGLAIRAYLLEKGVEPDRIDIRALGENSTEKPLDRADLMIMNFK